MYGACARVRGEVADQKKAFPYPKNPGRIASKYVERAARARTWCGDEQPVDGAAERNLIEKAQLGDWGAFEALVREHQDRVYCLAHRLVGGHQEADLVTQDVFIQAFEDLKGFEGRSRLMTWLYAITVSKVQDRRRVRKRRPPVLSLSRWSDVGADMRRPSADDPAEELASKEFTQCVEAAIASLPHDQKAALSMVAQEGLSYRKASNVLACSVGTVAWRVWEARRRLREMLRPHLT